MLQTWEESQSLELKPMKIKLETYTNETFHVISGRHVPQAEKETSSHCCRRRGIFVGLRLVEADKAVLQGNPKCENKGKIRKPLKKNCRMCYETIKISKRN